MSKSTVAGDPSTAAARVESSWSGKITLETPVSAWSDDFSAFESFMWLYHNRMYVRGGGAMNPGKSGETPSFMELSLVNLLGDCQTSNWYLMNPELTQQSFEGYLLKRIFAKSDRGLSDKNGLDVGVSREDLQEQIMDGKTQDIRNLVIIKASNDVPVAGIAYFKDYVGGAASTAWGVLKKWATFGFLTAEGKPDTTKMKNWDYFVALTWDMFQKYREFMLDHYVRVMCSSQGKIKFDIEALGSSAHMQLHEFPEVMTNFLRTSGIAKNLKLDIIGCGVSGVNDVKENGSIVRASNSGTLVLQNLDPATYIMMKNQFNNYPKNYEVFSESKTRWIFTVPGQHLALLRQANARTATTLVILKGIKESVEDHEATFVREKMCRARPRPGAADSDGLRDGDEPDLAQKEAQLLAEGNEYQSSVSERLRQAGSNNAEIEKIRFENSKFMKDWKIRMSDLKTKTHRRILDVQQDIISAVIPRKGTSNEKTLASISSTPAQILLGGSSGSKRDRYPSVISRFDDEYGEDDSSSSQMSRSSSRTNGSRRNIVNVR